MPICHVPTTLCTAMPRRLYENLAAVVTSVRKRWQKHGGCSGRVDADLCNVLVSAHLTRWPARAEPLPTQKQLLAGVC